MTGGFGNLHKRVLAIEQRIGPLGRWHSILVDIGDTVDAARSRYEAEHGAIPVTDRLIVDMVVCPSDDLR